LHQSVYLEQDVLIKGSPVENGNELYRAFLFLEIEANRMSNILDENFEKQNICPIGHRTK